MRRSLLTTLVFLVIRGTDHQTLAKPVQGDVLMAVAMAFKAIPDNINVDISLPGRVNTSCYSSGSWTFATVSCNSYVTPPQNVQFAIPRSVVYNQIAVAGEVITTRCISHRVTGNCRWMEPGAFYRVALADRKLRIETYRHGDQQRPVWLSFDILDRRSPPLRKASVTKDNWCFKDLTDVAIVYKTLQQQGIAAAKVQAKSLVDQSKVVPLIIGDQVLVGITTPGVSRIMPPQQEVPFCYFDTHALSFSE